MFNEWIKEGDKIEFCIKEFSEFSSAIKNEYETYFEFSKLIGYENIKRMMIIRGCILEFQNHQHAFMTKRNLTEPSDVRVLFESMLEEVKEICMGNLKEFPYPYKIVKRDEIINKLLN